MCYFLLQSFLNILMSHVSVFLCKKHNKDIYTTAFYHRLSSWLWCNTTTLLHLFQHQLIHTADPIMSAGRDSFRGLESIIDSVGCVLFDSKFIFFQLEEKGICKRVWGGGDEEPLRCLRKWICWAGSEVVWFGSSGYGGTVTVWLEQTWVRQRLTVVMLRFMTLGKERWMCNALKE